MTTTATVTACTCRRAALLLGALHRAAGLATLPDVVLVRHGRTFMNEHLSQPGKAWGSAGLRWLGRARDGGHLGDRSSSELFWKLCL